MPCGPELAFFDEFGPAFGTADGDTTLATRNSYLLPAAGTAVEAIFLTLGKLALLLISLDGQTVSGVEELLVLCIPLGDVAREHPVIGVAEQRKGQQIEQIPSAEQREHTKDNGDSQKQPRKLIYAVSSGHKLLKFLFHNHRLLTRGELYNREGRMKASLFFCLHGRRKMALCQWRYIFLRNILVFG